MNYFTNCNTIEEIKKEYRALAFKNHPDLGGSEEVMKEINKQYHEALKQGHGKVSTDEAGVEHTYRYKQDIEQGIIDKIDQLLALQMEGVDILLIGTWIWIVGTTKPYKKELGKGGAGCRWHGQRGCWYWTANTGSRYSSGGDLESLAKKYGVEKFAAPKRKKIA